MHLLLGDRRRKIGKRVHAAFPFSCTIAKSIYNASLMNVQQCIEMLQQHDGNLPIQFYINKMPIANVDVSIDYQLEQFVAFSLVSCCDDDATS